MWVQTRLGWEMARCLTRGEGGRDSVDRRLWGLRKEQGPGKTPFWFEWVDNLELLREGENSVFTMLR